MYSSFSPATLSYALLDGWSIRVPGAGVWTVSLQENPWPRIAQIQRIGFVIIREIRGHQHSANSRTVAINRRLCQFIAMYFWELAARVGPGGLFRTGQILAGEHSPADVRRQLDRWVKSGRVIQLRRGVYVMARPHGQAMVHPFTAANALKKASYVSLHSALAHYGMIPEYVPVTTSVTTGRPEELETPVGRFQFRHVASRLFFGFAESEIAPGQFALLADPSKALVDLLYLTPYSDHVTYLRELRLARTEHLDADALRKTADRSGSAKVKRAVERLLEQLKGERAQ